MRGENNLIPRFYCVTVTCNCVAVKGLCMRLGRELAQAVGSLFKSLGDLRRLQWQTLLNNFRTGWCSRVTRKVFRLLYPMNHLNCGRNDRTIPPLKPIPMIFFFWYTHLQPCSVRMMVMVVGGEGVSIGFIYKFIYFLFCSKLYELEQLYASINLCPQN